ncbi:G-type lectin S-receptor-like serine/threonine-protein kinase At4g27290 isoform X2 [Ricinus communis]|uniref:G-type lectin S-receptor-like serine/threonine-protein kinase At4g27290 isoform X2 n=1 Tax=Ricinus communis TaxID=3988 RepID=UPI00201B050B|nr:G-type lectin S-receptor-like serine/threonine-protein kinase At4g27290 isoform X2 [Ricinus communis]
MRAFGFSIGSFRFFFILLAITCSALDTISPNQPLSDGGSLVSANGNYELGFLSLTDPRRRYLGLWYRKISPRTIVWVANRETSLSNTTATLNITSQGNLVLLNSTNDLVWLSNTSRIAKNPVAQLLDTGNIVIREANDSKNYLWQSFDHPGDTVLPGMKVGINLVTGHETFQSSWKSIDDPALGQFSFHLDTRGYPQLLLKKEDRVVYRAGSWNGLRLTGTPILRLDPVFTYEFEINAKEIYFKFDVLNLSIFSRYALSPTGLVQRLSWDDRAQDWVTIATAQTDQCENYAFCGANASCEINNSPICVCLDGFTPKTPTDWNMQVWSDGCVRRTPLDCSKDGFVKRTGVKLPDTSSSWYDKTIDLKECERLCLRNCSCSAYSNLDIRNGGSGCLIWFNDLIDIRGVPAGGEDLHIRVASSELPKTKKKEGSFGKVKAGLIAGTAVIVIISMIVGFYMWRRNFRKQEGSHIQEYESKDAKEGMELPVFDLSTIIKATDDFASYNKLGEGGFGIVYKGTLADGQEIAVKRLSESSGQGSTEFKNEVILISKLQHRNLVKLLGCCIQNDEKMLIYEYMPNKSLDFFIFDPTKRKLLDWDQRVHIIGGIAKGLLYLHHDSRLRIIHRDLKASNVLLDKDMNPKISDFGMARMFGGDQTEANTKKVAGTYGYMSPEYAVDGLFSMKSDVFSFGVLVLEIVNGKKNRGFFHPDHNHNLLGHAWKLWIEEKALELVDKTLDSYALPEILRCIHVGLLCVQQRPEDRPNMASVIVMLSSECSLPEPRQPGFFTERNMPDAGESSSSKLISANEMSATVLEPR